MKLFFCTITLLAASVSFAQIKNSDNDQRHQSVIATVIQERCGRMSDLTQIAQREVKVLIDQGVVDIRYTTLLTAKLRVDQMLYDDYEITVESEKSDTYDHTTGAWGSYGVLSVACTQK